MTETLASYDWLPYERDAIAPSHPDRLATVALLRGMTPAPVEACRVLELGCATGANLIPMALTLPGSRFLGIDLSRGQIDEGKQLLGRLGLQNIELRHASILDFTHDGEFEPRSRSRETSSPNSYEFDYIICHGVYSWVPPAVQDKILEICQTNLAANGVAYVSYNTYPGWHVMGTLRDVMLFHAGSEAELADRLERSREMIDFLAESMAHDGSPYSQLLRAELDQLRQLPDSYLLHEHLDDCNSPLYFHEFMQRISARRLRYLGEAHVATMWPSNFLPDVEKRLHQIAADTLHLEQYMDVLRNRPFRQTLLCHEAIELSKTVSPEFVRRCHVASQLRPVAGRPDVTSSSEESFRAPDGLTLSVGMPFLKAALFTLAELWPLPVPFDTLCERARSMTGKGGDEAQLASRLLECFLRNLVELRVQPPCFTTAVADRPRGSPWARLQAERGPRVTDLRHEAVELGDLERLVLIFADGSRSRADLKDVFRTLMQQGKIRLAIDAGQGPEAVDRALEPLLDQALETLAVNALLMAK